MTEEREDAMTQARRLMQPSLAKRFYENATVQAADEGFAVLLDGRPVRTPARTIVATPWRALSEALAGEWAAQAEFINPSTMPLSRIVNSAIDGVAREVESVRAEIVKYAGSDLLCYRAEGPERLVERQSRAWDPVLAWARDDLGARFVLAEGVMFTDQPGDAVRAVERALEDLDVFRLAATHVATTLTGSSLLALALLRGHLPVEEAWAAAHVDEDWTNELWGSDEEAELRRARRFEEMQAAARILSLSR
ncbi:ATP12 family chaperone protein [Terrihabitans sp. B22-R8]|uniref:ATP12 family chaperone protein n=1 Tax=Terrihabitans sp. B22-R8 TaxID=3425128 RepID=UPI00403CED16